MTFLEAKKIVEERGYRIAKNIEGESFRERVAREELEEAKRVARRAGYQIINEDEATPYETALLDKNFTNFVASISNDNDYNANEEKYASWVDTLVNEEGWDVYDAIDHVISKNWSEYHDEILDRALNDDISTEEAERIADLVATPLSSIDYEEVLLDPSLYKDEDIDEGCCGAGSKKKKGKKKGKKSEFVPFWAKKKDGKLNEDFGDTEGTTFTNICQEYVSGGKFFAIVAQVGLQGAIEKVLADVKTAVGQGIGDKYYNTFATRLRQAKSPTDALYKITNAMLAGENMDSAAGTRQSAYNRNRGVGRGRR